MSQQSSDSDSLNRVSDIYMRCVNAVGYMAYNRWFTSTTKEDLNNIHNICVDYSLGIEECTLECQSHSDWKSRKECWNTCMKIMKKED